MRMSVVKNITPAQENLTQLKKKNERVLYLLREFKWFAV